MYVPVEQLTEGSGVGAFVGPGVGAFVGLGVGAFVGLGVGLLIIPLSFSSLVNSSRKLFE